MVSKTADAEALRIVLDAARDWTVGEEEAEGALEREEDNRRLRGEPPLNDVGAYPDADLAEVLNAIAAVDRVVNEGATLRLFYIESTERDGDGDPVVSGCVVAGDAEIATELVREWQPTTEELRTYEVSAQLSLLQAPGLVDMRRAVP